ncbi:hypothetical protein QBC38DRAFT_487461 [Podospora fimiseda]|uniref:Uncharacterized protein n=1 Tax=Podospora fimiseda TaxID=252190 RepID=A0AAN7BHJ7_9PEZI|nr:hypothetical protein QBC38DRAFT_487461 [Podospora fimiseda]
MGEIGFPNQTFLGSVRIWLFLLLSRSVGITNGFLLFLFKPVIIIFIIIIGRVFYFLSVFFGVCWLSNGVLERNYLFV